MHCFPCFHAPKEKKSSTTNETNDNETRPSERRRTDETEQSKGTTLKTFTFRELATATKNFRQECLLGEGGFGRVYKGTLQSTGQVVAVKQLDKHGLHGSKEFQAEVLSLGQLDHPNLVKLIGYCADGDQRLLVYDYISGGSLQDQLHELKSDCKPMDWKMRMKIAYDTAQGLDYLHDKANPPVIYRDLKASNILLDDEFSPKLSDFGLHNLGPSTGDKTLSSRVMGTYGYSAPEYIRGGNLTMKSDVYSFGVVLLELITGRKALDTTRPNDEQNLVSWVKAQPIFRDPKRYPDMADPVLEKKFSERELNQAVAIASMCVQEEATARPLISDVMVALSFLWMPTEDGVPTAVQSFRDKSMSIALSRHDSSFVSHPLGLELEDDESSTSSDEESSLHSENEIVSKKKHEEEESSTEYDSTSDDEHENDKDNSPPKHIDEKNQAQSLKIKYRYSWEEVDVNDEKLSSKSSHESNDENTSTQYDSYRDHDDSPKEKEKEEEEEEEHTHLEHIHSSKTDDDQSVYFDDDDDDDDDDSVDDNGASLQQTKSESVKDDNGGFLRRIKSEVEINSC